MIRRPGAGRGGSLPTSYGGGGTDELGGSQSSSYGSAYGSGGGGIPASPASGGYSGGYAAASPGVYGANTTNGYGTGGGGGGYAGGGGGGYSGSQNAYGHGGAYGGPLSSSTAYSNGNGEFKDKRRGGSSGNSIITKVLYYLKQPSTWPILSTLFFMVLTYRYRSNFNAVLKIMDLKKGTVKDIQQAWEDVHGDHSTKSRHLSTMHEQHSKLNQRLTECEAAKRNAFKERDEIRVKYEKNPPNHATTATAASGKQSDDLKLQLEQREKAMREQLSLLQNATQRESRRSAIERFGPGPHYVEFTVDIPSEHHEYGTNLKTFTIEMAPLSAMPHAVYLFMEQVAHGLWNNAWFYINGPHVLQAGPQADDDEIERAIAAANGHEESVDERAIALRPFKEKDLASLSFSEYSDKFPHIQWTLGFTGRPGGPDFYINKMDNTESHGPGGQHHHHIAESADACFARMYSGFDTIQELLRVPTVTDDPSYKFFFEEPIHIIKVSILREPPFQTPLDMQLLAYTPEQKQQRELQHQQRVQQQAAAFNAAATAASNTAGAGTAAAANNNLNNGAAMGTQGGSYFVNNNPHAQAEQFANYGSNTVNQQQQQQQQQQQHHPDPNANAAYQQQQQQQHQQVNHQEIHHNGYAHHDDPHHDDPHHHDAHHKRRYHGLPEDMVDP